MDKTMNQIVSWQQRLERRTEALVNAADQALSEERMKLLLMGRDQWEKAGYPRNDNKSPMKASQFSNFLGVAKAPSDSPAAIRNWVLYQMGRSETQANWGKTGLGTAIIKDMATFGDWAAEIAADVYGKATDEQVRRAQVALITQYAGYLRRWFIAKGGSE